MPLYEYYCPECEGKQEEIFARFDDSPTERPCWVCGHAAKRIVSLPNFKIVGEIIVNDSGDVWEGTPLADVDKTNPLTYKSDKIFIDQGRKTAVSGKSKPKPTKGVGALGV